MLSPAMADSLRHVFDYYELCGKLCLGCTEKVSDILNKRRDGRLGMGWGGESCLFLFQNRISSLFYCSMSKGQSNNSQKY